MKIGIALAIVFLLVGAIAITSTGSIPSLQTITGSALTQSPTYTFEAWDYRSIPQWYVNITMLPVSGLFNEGGNPMIISSWLPNQESSQFGNIAIINESTVLPQLFVNVSWSVLLENVTTGITTDMYPNAYHENLTPIGGSIVASKQTTDVAFPTFGMLSKTQVLQGVVILQANVTVYSTPEWDIGAIHKTHNVFREFYLVPGSGDIAVSPTVQQVGGNIYIHGHVNFGTYYVILEGSSSYNNGAIVENYSINNGAFTTGQSFNFTYKIPTGAFTPNGGNQWNVTLWNSLIAQHTVTFFTVDQLNLTPPLPKVSITNTPSNDKWVIGSIVDVSVHTSNNPNSSNPVTHILVYVYYNVGGMPSEYNSSYWIINDQSYGIQNGYGNFTFQLGDALESVSIQVVAMDSVGRASGLTAPISIQASQLTTGNNTITIHSVVPVLLAIMGFAITELIVFFILPVSMIDKAIATIGSGGMWWMLYYAIDKYLTMHVVLPASIVGGMAIIGVFVWLTRGVN